MKKMIKRISTLLLAVAVATSFAGCSKNDSEAVTAEGNKAISKLSIGFVPSRDAEEIITTTEPLKNLLIEELAKSGYEVGSVDITVGTSFEAVGEALAAGSLDIGFVSGGTYVQYEDETTPVLTATRSGFNKDSENAADWNDGQATVRTDDQVTYYKALVIAGPSEKGQELAAKVNAGEELTWDDLNSARWAVGGTSSNAGYVYPCLYLNNVYGKSITDLSSVTPGTAYATAAAQLAAEQIDVMVAYADARMDYEDAWTNEMGRTASIYEETNVIAVTENIYNDCIITSNSSKNVDDDFIAAFQQAMMNIAQTEEGKEVISIYSHEGYQIASPSDYEGTKAAQELLKSLDN